MTNLRTARPDKKRILVIFALLVLAGFLIFVFAPDFGLVRSESAADSQVRTFSAMDPPVDRSKTVTSTSRAPTSLAGRSKRT